MSEEQQDLYRPSALYTAPDKQPDYLHTDCNANPERYGYIFANINEYSDQYINCDANVYDYTNLHTHGNINQYTQRYTDQYPNCYVHKYPAFANDRSELSTDCQYCESEECFSLPLYQF